MHAPRPSNISTYNERTFRPSSPSVLLDNQGRQYRPTAYDDEQRVWHYACRMNPRHDIEYPAPDDTIVLRTQYAHKIHEEALNINVTDDVVAVGIVETSFFRRPKTPVPKELKSMGIKVSTTVGIVTLRKHAKFLKNIKTWH